MTSPTPITTAVLTERKLTNTSTGLDVSVIDFELLHDKERRLAIGFEKTQVNFHLLIVTDQPVTLGCRSARDDVTLRDGSAVHFTLGRKYEKFVEMRNALDQKYSGTYFRPLPKNVVTGTSLVTSHESLRKHARKRQAELDEMMQSCASNPKISSSSIFLRFLGLSMERNQTARGKIETTENAPVDESLFGDNGYEFARNKEQLFNDDNDEETSDTDQEKNSSIDKETTLKIRTRGGMVDDNSKGFDLFDKSSLFSDKSPIFEEREHMSDATSNDIVFSAHETLGGMMSEERRDEEDLLNLDDLSELASKMKKVEVSATQTEKYAEQRYGTGDEVLFSEESVVSMDDDDLLAYINSKSVSAEIDLGF